ncbi:hypothetical protein KUCAC02_004492 [Chaenocephalus aceratus]|uniref:Uncharacterized protein n=1 Tax=Chaenocephalus aceratus TaxID=36190 RepID=A0ACB9X0G1_CHAAC|nr:hypothetical protein KUCAC02_004492 [Chaenocephalus aceratus]
MADVSGSKLSEEKEAEIERKKRQKRPWDELHKSGKIGITPDLPETLGFFDISAVRRREQREAAAGTQQTVHGIKQPAKNMCPHHSEKFPSLSPCTVTLWKVGALIVWTAEAEVVIVADNAPVLTMCSDVVPDPSLTRFISAELTRGYFLEHNEAKYTERRERVYTCMRIPKELEKLTVSQPVSVPRPLILLVSCNVQAFHTKAESTLSAELMTFGFFLCVDAFLYVFTLLPLRVLLAVLRLLTLPCCGFRECTGTHMPLLQKKQPAQVCDVLKGLIMVLCFSMMHYVDYSMMYHLIRGQSVIKLYIIYNMLEVADRLFSSFGQDILDALYWTATEPKERKRDSIGVIPHFFMAVFYVFLHAILIMVQASTLNVAFNSHNKSLLTIMMSNNFVEIKGSVFKKFEKNNLFQMSNSDIKERFTSYVLLLIVCLRNMEQFAWNPDHLWVLFPDVFMVVTSEVAVDIIKHAFITKFNDITADVYSEYRASLAFDLVSSRQKNACTDYSDSVARRMGFIPLPLAVLLIRVVMSSVKVQGALSYTCVFLCYLGLVTLKVLNSIVLLGKSCVYVKRANMEDKLFETPAPPPASSTSSSKTPSRAEASCPTPPEAAAARLRAPRSNKQFNKNYFSCWDSNQPPLSTLIHTRDKPSACFCPEGMMGNARLHFVYSEVLETCGWSLQAAMLISRVSDNDLEDSSSLPQRESKMEPAPVTLCSPPPSSSCSVTTQPSPRTDLFPPQPADHSPAATPPRPPTPTPEPEPPAPPLSKEEGEGEEAAAATELKHRTPNKDLLEIDRFTICGNRID